MTLQDIREYEKEFGAEAAMDLFLLGGYDALDDPYEDIIAYDKELTEKINAE